MGSDGVASEGRGVRRRSASGRREVCRAERSTLSISFCEWKVPVIGSPV